MVDHAGDARTIAGIGRSERSVRDQQKSSLTSGDASDSGREVMAHRRRLLWVTPYPPRRGQSAARERFWALLASIARRHDVSLITQLDDAERELPPDLPPGLADAAYVRLAGEHVPDPCRVLPLEVRWGAVSPVLRQTVEQRLARERFDVVQWEFTEMGAAMPPPTIPTIVTAHQLGFAAALPEWRARGGVITKFPRALGRHLRSLHFELSALSRAHLAITTTPEDAARLRTIVPTARIAVVPCGVDAELFAPHAGPSSAPRTDLLFVGNFGHAPNRDAVRFVVREVLPALRAHGVKLLRVVGRHATRLHGLAEAAGVELVGEVEDVRPHLRAAQVVIAPVRFGTGMRGKILEALAMGKPVVSTPLGAEGLGACPGTHLLLATTASQWVAAIGRLRDDPALRERLGREGRDLVLRRFTWQHVARAQEEAYERVLVQPVAPRCVPFQMPRPLPTRLSAFPGPVRRRIAAAAGLSRISVDGLRWYVGRSWP